MKRILVTGAAGFIGAKVCELLLKQNYLVVGVDNFNEYYSRVLKEFRLQRLRVNKNFKFFELDIENQLLTEDLFKQFSFFAIINLAARAGVRYSELMPKAYFETNVLGTLNLLQLAKTFNVGKFVMASTSSSYAGLQVPFHEEMNVNRPLSPYAASKLAAETLCFSYAHLYNLQITIFRYFTVYGPAGRPDMSPYRFVNWIIEDKPIRIFGNGLQNRDFTYIDDIARGTIAALELNRKYEVINLGRGQFPTSLLQMIKIIEKLSSKKAKIQFLQQQKTDMESTQADISKAKQILKWQPEVSLEDGIAFTYKWHIENFQLVKQITTAVD